MFGGAALGVTIFLWVVPMRQTKPVMTQAFAFTQVDVAHSSDMDLRIVFYGYPEIGLSKSGSAIITQTGLSDMRDITFTRVGGELSPDGRLIAYDNCRIPNRGIYLAGPDGSKARKLLAVNNQNCVNLRWSPDSTKLSYVSDADHSLHIFDIARRRDRAVPNTQLAGWHWWSPAGDKIVYSRRASAGSGNLLYITDLLGKSRQLTFARDFAPCKSEDDLIDTRMPAWSPHGDKIAFTQCGALFVISPDAEGLRQLTARERAASPDILSFAAADNPRWTPDGKWIVFSDGIAFVGVPVALKRISADGATVVEIGELPYGGGSFSIAPVKRGS